MKDSCNSKPAIKRYVTDAAQKALGLRTKYMALPDSECGFVYFILTPELNRVKIGHSKVPFIRMTDLQVYCPCKLKILGLFIGSRQMEQDLHEQFSADSVIGEWFEYSPDIQAHLECHQEQNILRDYLS